MSEIGGSELNDASGHGQEQLHAQLHNFTLHRDEFGKLVFTAANGDLHRNVIPVRAFPIGAPDDGIALVGYRGQELAWIDSLSDVSASVRELIVAELASREFMPEIKRIVKVSSYSTPCNWSVQTSCGDTVFNLKGEEDIRRILRSSLLIADAHGVHFLVRDLQALDKTSRKILDRFL